ncbi:sugar ABC transporter permease [Oscillospiraceae bacterium DSM 107454]|uniref:Sugar ABC transporter permease n=2 Tax=Ructibacterium gallinarum TaxID=2779355 RepID=A0A9D5LZ95_9FIRM|nr:sugar ABC transporter permease [Ructibacterium gallinarum]
MNRLIRDKWLYIFLIPFLLWYVLFAYVPMYGLQIAFKDYNLFKGITESPWVGMEHFKTFFESPYFFRLLKNTIIISLMNLVFAFPLSVIFALMLNEVKNKWFKKTVQTVTYLPYFISIVVVTGIVTSFLAPSNGIVNIIIAKLGGEKQYFLMQKESFRWIYLLMNIWKDTGYNSIVYIAALAAVDSELYEAASIDGAGKLRQILHVSLPGILPTVIIMFILKLGTIMEVGYEAIILLYQPATYETADVISTFVYRTGLLEGKYDYATAVGLFNAVIALVLVLTVNHFSNRLAETGLW